MEFAKHGYEKASTNRIVKEAGIGKGMLFYYFKSKKELYHYLFDYCMKFIISEYLSKIDENERDFIERYKQAGQAKLKANVKNPGVFTFLGSFVVNQNIDLPEKIEKQYKELRTLGYSKIYNNIDTSLFREDVEGEKIFKFIRWSMEGYEKELLQRLQGVNLSTFDATPYWDEFYEYLDDLKKIFYK
ncbi:AcrR family transcriptional regulator [Evansella vedderi]|uniref:AcrR family transcriptional regulator n=2 Tax=Evansella vedderi TaxID=38282 RepID=A0ABT9ZVM0_9BACI|nr:AcrR family transcriptional regulator [Evansella vedderi]